jgi:3-methylcrotonyl-CoA carboxylase alpha subunit
MSVKLDDEVVRGVVLREGESIHVFWRAMHHVLHILDPLAHAGQSEAEVGRLSAPMPGKIIAVLVEAGAVVEKGRALLIMEAMKMEHTIFAPAAGVVESILYAIGDQVAEGAPLLSLTLPEQVA